MGTMEKKLSYLLGTKNAIKEAIVSKGVNITDDHTFRDYADKIMEIRGKEYYVPSLPSKGGVDFYDYDGGILHTYTKDEFLALSEMPALPERLGLVCQGWNYSLEDAKAYVEEYGVLHIGAMYITDDGKTRLYITIDSPFAAEVPLYFNISDANGLVIDWGDGKKEPITGSGDLNVTHNYEEIGDYVIALEVAEGCIFGLGVQTGSYSYTPLFGSNRVYRNRLKKVEIGSSVTSIGNQAFNNCYSLSSVVIPNGVTSIDNSAFNGCYSLSSVVIPNGVTSIGNQAFYNCYSLSSVVIPNGVTSIGNQAFQSCSFSSIVIPQGVTKIGSEAFYYCYSLSSVVILQGVTMIDSKLFQSCYSLSSVVIPQGVTKIEGNVFNQCYSLSSIVIPQSVTSIGNQAFYYCHSLVILDFSESTSVPTLSSTSAIPSHAELRIVVPDDLYDTWIAATNWSSYASKIIKASEFNA